VTWVKAPTPSRTSSNPMMHSSRGRLPRNGGPGANGRLTGGSLTHGLPLLRCAQGSGGPSCRANQPREPRFPLRARCPKAVPQHMTSHSTNAAVWLVKLVKGYVPRRRQPGAVKRNRRGSRLATTRKCQVQRVTMPELAHAACQNHGVGGPQGGSRSHPYPLYPRHRPCRHLNRCDTPHGPAHWAQPRACSIGRSHERWSSAPWRRLASHSSFQASSSRSASPCTGVP
jgi:hypothetical protein